MFVLEGVTYGIVAAVCMSGMYFICLRTRRDQREIRDLLRATTPLPTASIVMIVAVPVHALEVVQKIHGTPQRIFVGVSPKPPAPPVVMRSLFFCCA